MTPTTRVPDLLTHALVYAEHGVPVFPCVPGGKTPLTSNGFLSATTDPDQIRRWWTWRPQANIATPTGAPGFDVLDVDVRPDGNGWAAYRRATVSGALDGWQRAIRTPSGGLHLHYPGTDQRNGSLHDQHIDFRGVGGYVLLPPSLGQTKAYSRRYEVIRSITAPGRPLDWGRVTNLIAPPAPARAPRPESPHGFGRPAHLVARRPRRPPAARQPEQRPVLGCVPRLRGGHRRPRARSSTPA